MIYDGVDLEDYFRINYSMPGTLNQTLNMVKVPGRAGKRIKSIEHEEMRIPVTIRLKDHPWDEMGERRAFYRDLLCKTELCEVMFPDEGDWYWYGAFEGEAYFDTLWYTGVCEATFVCPDPIATSLDKHEVEVDSRFTGTYQGTWKTNPVIEAWPKSGTYFEVANAKTGHYVRVETSGFNGKQHVVIDMDTEQTTINGENVAVVFASTYFPLEPGDIDIRFSHPSTLIWRDRRK